MENKEQIYFGKIVKVDESEKFIECNIYILIHQTNMWKALTGCLDAFLARMEKAKTRCRLLSTRSEYSDRHLERINNNRRCFVG